MFINLTYRIKIEEVQMTEEKKTCLWAETRKKMEAQGWRIFKLRSSDPNWSPENPGDFMKGDWGWKLGPPPPEHKED